MEPLQPACKPLLQASAAFSGWELKDPVLQLADYDRVDDDIGIVVSQPLNGNWRWPWLRCLA